MQDHLNDLVAHAARNSAELLNFDSVTLESGQLVVDCGYLSR